MIQIARHRGCEVYVVTRERAHQRVGPADGRGLGRAAPEEMPVKVDSAIIFAPAGELVPPALEKLEQGRHALAGRHLHDADSARWTTSGMSSTSATSTRSPATPATDGRELLAEAAAIPVRPHTTVYPLADANRALAGPQGRPHQRHGRAGDGLRYQF